MYVLTDKTFTRVLIDLEVSIAFTEINTLSEQDFEKLMVFDSKLLAWIYKTFCYGDKIVDYDYFCDMIGVSSERGE